MAFATTSLQGRSDEQRFWDLHLAMPDDETQHREPTKDVHDQEHDLDAYMRERKPHDPLNLDYMSWSRSADRLGWELTELGGSIARRLRDRLMNRH